MTFKKKTHASYSQRNEFWQDVDMDLYHSNENYRDKVERAWDKHRYAYDFKIYDAMRDAMNQAAEEMEKLEKYLDETRIDTDRANRED